jgi:protein SCO1/2
MTSPIHPRRDAIRRICTLSKESAAMHIFRTWLLAVMTLLFLGGCTSYTFKSATIEPPDVAYPIVLTDQNGQQFSMSTLDNKVALVFFGYTYCPDICPATLSDLQLVKQRLGERADSLAVVFITVDPERDNPERLKRFVGMYDDSVIALTGDTDALARVYQAYGAGAQRRETPDSALVYAMDHTSTITVIDKKGFRRLLIGFGSPLDDVVADVTALIAE